MSPASRGRKSKRTSGRRGGLTLVPGGGQGCGCPVCSGQHVDRPEMLDDLLQGVEAAAAGDDALGAELAGAAVVAMVTTGGADLVPTFVQTLVPEIEAKGNGAALALLLAVGSVAARVRQEVAAAASAAADRLVAAGIPAPRWAGELAEPVRVGHCLRLYDTGDRMSVLAVLFQRGGREHALLMMVDEIDYGMTDILVVDGDQLPLALDDIRTGAHGDGLDMRTQALKPAELRWYAEQALDARAMDERGWLAEMASQMSNTDGEDDGPPYGAMAALARRRLADLPKPRKPAGARPFPDPDDADDPVALQTIARLLLGNDPFGGLPFGEPAPAKLPRKRKKSDGPAPIYQIKVGLCGAKPPIWRRLMVPADVNLGRLHDIIQVAFRWNDSHLHVFETPYGRFGHADPDLGHRAEGRVTLEQVAAGVKDRIRYTYDFGDGWDHDITVEKVLDRDSTLAYPLCTGGRRAAPPDDCGGIGGYHELVEIIADRRHPEHGHMLDWLDLDDPREFDPEAFDVDEVNMALRAARLGQRPTLPSGS